MTRPARRRHLTAWVVLTPLILAVLIAAIAQRAARAALGALPASTEVRP